METTRILLFGVLLGALSWAAAGTAWGDPISSFGINPNPAWVGQTVYFDGSWSSPGAGESLSDYDWDFGDGYSSSGSADATTHTYTTIGRHAVTLTVTDTSGASALSTYAMDVYFTNHAPAADAGGPYFVSEGSSLTLDGTGSSDPDAVWGDSIEAYGWDLDGDGSDDVTGASPTLTAGMLAGYGLTAGSSTTIHLLIYDAQGAADTATSTITMTGAPAVPEPASLALVSLGVAGLAVRRRRRSAA